MATKKHIIFTNYEFDFDEYCDTVLQEEIEEGFLDGDDLTVDAKWRMYDDYLNDWLENEIDILNISVENPIIAIANLGLWNGRTSGYRILTEWNVQDILSSFNDCDYVTWYFDGYNVRFEGHHHDGTNYVEFRVIKNSDNIDRLIDKLYNNEPISRSMINYYTRSLAPEMKKIYGW